MLACDTSVMTKEVIETAKETILNSSIPQFASTMNRAIPKINDPAMVESKSLLPALMLFQAKRNEVWMSTRPAWRKSRPFHKENPSEAKRAMA